MKKEHNKIFEKYLRRTIRLLCFEKVDLPLPDLHKYDAKRHSRLIKQKTKSECELRKKVGEKEASKLIEEANENVHFAGKRIDLLRIGVAKLGGKLPNYDVWDESKEGHLKASEKKQIEKETREKAESQKPNLMNRIAKNLLQRS